jgi:hypothetical protein
MYKLAEYIKKGQAMDIIFFPQITEISAKKQNVVDDKKRKKFRFEGKIVQINVENDKTVLKIVTNMPYKELKALLNEDVVILSK